MPRPSIALVIGTIRPDRFADKPAQWMLERARAFGQADCSIVDLRDYSLPMFAETESPMFSPPESSTARRWLQSLAEHDAYIFLTAEYNYSISGALKNALDYVYHECYRKPVAFVGYGDVGGARAVQELRLIAVELQMAPLRNAVHICGFEFLELGEGKKRFADFPHLEKAASVMLDDLVWWANTLKAGRSERRE